MAPHFLTPQTQEDRDRLRAIGHQLPNWPQDLVFPLEVDPNYVPHQTVTYLYIIGTILATTTIMTVMLRLWIRSRGSFGPDDWVILPAFLAYTAFTLTNLVGCIVTGLGYHIYDLSIKDINSAYLIMYIHAILWILSEHLVRCSVVHLFLRITPRSSPKSRIYLMVLLGVSYSYMVANIIICIFECHPVASSWDIEKRFSGHCATAKSITTYGILCVGHVILDLFTLIPPMIVINKLSMTKHKKINLYVLLGLGLSSILPSLLRLFVYYRKTIDNYDQTRDIIAVGVCATVENSMSLIIACLPSLNHFYRGLANKIKTQAGTRSQSVSPSDSGHQKNPKRSFPTDLSQTRQSFSQESFGKDPFNEIYVSGTYKGLEMDLMPPFTVSGNVSDVHVGAKIADEEMGKPDDKVIVVQRTVEILEERR